MPEKRRAAGGNRRPGDIGGGPKTSQGQYSTRARGRQLLYDARGRRVASVAGGVLRKTIHGQRHILRNPPAIAFDVAIVDAAQQAGATEVEVTDSDSGRQFWCTLSAFREHAFELNRGFGCQLALPLTRWVIRASDQADLPRQLAMGF